MDLAIVDAIGVELLVGMACLGEPCRFAQLVEHLGDRNFLHVSLRPEWRVGGRDLPRELLGIAPDNEFLGPWVTLARRDPKPEPCPVCEKYRGHSFEQQQDGTWLRRWPHEPLPADSSVFVPSTEKVL